MMANVYLCYKGGGLGSRQLEQGMIHGRRQSPSCQYCMTSQKTPLSGHESKSRATAVAVSGPAAARPAAETLEPHTRERSKSRSLAGWYVVWITYFL